jgi:hypothetical protein
MNCSSIFETADGGWKVAGNFNVGTEPPNDDLINGVSDNHEARCKGHIPVKARAKYAAL